MRPVSSRRWPPARPARIAPAAALILAAAACTGGDPGSGATGGAGAPPATARETLRRAGDWLWSRQEPDGAWRSGTHAFLRGGEALTPFILHALLEVGADACPPPAGAVERALGFIRRRVNAGGALGLGDPDVPEYPNYATAFALRCLLKGGSPGDRPLIARMRDFLLAGQYRPENGFGPDSPAHGGWGFGGPRPAGSPGHMDLSYTRHVLEALRQAGAIEDPVLERARGFLRYLQRHPGDRRPQPPFHRDGAVAGAAVPGAVPYDGGFYFSPVVLDANKGGIEPAAAGRPAYYRSYATATCDGVLALLASGVPSGDERVEAARRWLERHPRLEHPGGIPEDDPNRWGDALRFYHLAARAEAFEALEWPGGWRSGIAALLAADQRADGSFRNERNPLMKEDDPYLATALAVIALGRAARAE